MKKMLIAASLAAAVLTAVPDHLLGSFCQVNKNLTRMSAKDLEQKVPCPQPDATHRYIMVPLVYARPELGTFKLYYELNTDFDPAKKTLFYLHDGQQQRTAIGGPDELKKEYGLDMNVVRMEHRGMPCSKIDAVFTKDGVDWLKAYEVFRSENVIEDIDRIRVDLLGENGTLSIMGGSGGGVLSCQYLARHSIRVDRAYIMVASDNTASANGRQREKFFSILKNEGLTDAYLDILEKHTVPELEFLWIVQRLGYDFLPSDKKDVELIRSLQAGDRTLYDRYAEEYQDVEKIAEIINRMNPFTAVRIYEMFFETMEFSPKDPTYGLLEPLTRPLTALAKAGVIHPEIINVRPELAKIKTEVMLTTARWDHVLPYREMVDMNRNMPTSRLLIVDDLHTIKKSKKGLVKAVKAFLENGAWSPEVEMVLASGEIPLWKE